MYPCVCLCEYKCLEAGERSLVRVYGMFVVRSSSERTHVECEHEPIQVQMHIR